jgi:anti-anti-sigma factor
VAIEIKVLDEGPPGRIALIGRLDINEVGAIETKFVTLTATQRRPVIVDLSGLTFIGSLGIGMIVAAARALKRHGAGMVLLDPQPFIERIFDIAHVGEAVPVVHGIEEAQRALAGS